jgi:hypothetical protein
MAVVFSEAAASPFPCASMRGVQRNIATATAIITTKRFDISAASKFALFKLAEVFYTKSAKRAQIPLCYSCSGQSLDWSVL